MAEPKKTQKKTVRVQSTPEAQEEAAETWKPTPEAKSKATTRRIIALILWAVAIGGEAFAIFWLLRQVPFTTTHTVILVAILVVIAGLSIGGSMLWKQANRLDPARKSDTVRFFVQNQLGAIIAVIAFLPLIILIFLNKDMNGTQKAVAGGAGILLLLVAGFLGTSINPPSVEQYDEETNYVIELTGENLVYWTKSGKVYHLCEGASAVNLESEDNTIYSGTVADAHAAGKERLTLQVDQEIDQCGLAPVEGDSEEDTEVEQEVEETPAP
ncbi:hypothetical protein [Antiquaquibacter soli]|uniref:Uncharacterized protein n=1 Tax=Antiquaquibacter soli TaxID=3064523 RepID=A0ABT9BQB9_9MICO|nr:hypothetical protein [Protaetiibacter sp. WY-16]MDO7883202.1 hypothetical protein [Protaetiibacter sp. WY-16]